MSAGWETVQSGKRGRGTSLNASLYEIFCREPDGSRKGKRAWELAELARNQLLVTEPLRKEAWQLAGWGTPPAQPRQQPKNLQKES